MPSKRQTSSFLTNRHLGQNFLVRQDILDRIVEHCNLSPDETVLEIGPGQGALTERLLPQVRALYAVEKDRRLVSYLSKALDFAEGRLICADILRTDFSFLQRPAVLVGNIPYNISSPIIEQLARHKGLFPKIFLTVQWEFAKRLFAKAGTKDYGTMSCFAQYHFTGRILFKIPASAFRPAPKIMSCFIALQPRPAAVPREEEAALFSLIRKCFAGRRKKVINVLGVSRENGERILRELNIKPDARPDQVSLDLYLKIFKRMKENR